MPYLHQYTTLHYRLITHNTLARERRSLLWFILYSNVVTFSIFRGDNRSGYEKVTHAANPLHSDSTTPYSSSHKTRHCSQRVHKACGSRYTEHLLVGHCVPSETDNTCHLLQTLFNQICSLHNLFHWYP